MNTTPETTIAEWQALLSTGEQTTRQIAEYYLQRIAAIDQAGPQLRSVIEINPDALALAEALDRERRINGPRSPLHGIPILLKDNIDTTDRMLSTTGSLALTTSLPAQEATIATRLRAAGALILGKTNLSEWANFRSAHSISGWSGRGGQTRNPYQRNHNPSGSSSGSGVAVAANLCAAAIGTETDGSIVSPATVNGIVGIKPTVGLTSRAGVTPISHSQDTVGPMARCVADAATVLGALTGYDRRDAATHGSLGRNHQDYTRFLDLDGLRGARIGVARQVYFGYHAETDAVIEEAIRALREAGATIIDPADIATAQEIKAGDGEFKVLLYECKRAIAAYLATRIPHPDHPGAPIPRRLADLIAFNNQHAEQEMSLFGQDLFIQAEELALSEAEYRQILANNHRLTRRLGIDAVLDAHGLDALIAPTGAPAWEIKPKELDSFLGGCSSPAAMAGYPLITVPAGFVGTGFAGVLPVGITFMGRAYSEAVLIRLAYAFEQATKARRAPRFD